MLVRATRRADKVPVQAAGGTVPSAAANALPASSHLQPGDTSRGTNQAGVRLYNERLILSLVRRHGALPKVEIARLTGLSAQATTVIVKRLEADLLLLKGEPQRGRVGQPTVPFTLNPQGAYSFGLKIGRKSSELVLIDFCGTILARLVRAHAYPSPQGILDQVREGIAAMLADLAPEKQARLAGFGIAAPFELWNWGAETGAPPDILAQWRDFSIQAEIQALVPMPVYLCNDATSACAAETFFGEGWRYRDFLYIFIGSFVGGGLVIGGNLFVGRTGNAGAIGSMPVARVDKNGHLVRRQLIRSASIYVLEQQMPGAGLDPARLWRSPDDWGEIGPVLDQWVDVVAQDLALAIVSANAIVDLEGAIIDGAMPASIRVRIVESTRLAMAQLDLQGLTPVTLRAGSIGPHARAMGGAALPFLANFARDREVLFKEQLNTRDV